jgi:hypothetical protein
MNDATLAGANTIKYVGYVIRSLIAMAIASMFSGWLLWLCIYLLMEMLMYYVNNFIVATWVANDPNHEAKIEALGAKVLVAQNWVTGLFSRKAATESVA